MKSIGLKLWTGLMILVVLVLILLWFFQIVFLEKFYTSMRISEIKTAGYSVISEIEDIYDPDIRNLLDSFSFNNNLSIELLDNTRNVVYESSSGAAGHGPMMKSSIRLEAFSEVLQNKQVSIPLTHPRFGNKFMLIGLPVNISGQIQGVLFINMPLSPVQETATILKKQLVYITLILLTVASIISHLISKAFIRPILKIKKVSEKMASGDFTDRIEVESQDEIGQLVESINYMGQELSKIDQLRKDLVANVSHELRTPLSLIRGYAEIIRNVTGNIPEKREKQLEIIIDESERLSCIVNDMLNLSQMQSGYIKLNITSFSLNRLVERLKEKYEILSEKTGVAMRAESVAQIEVRADENKIEQVLGNLINNALNHTERGGMIVINLFEDSEYTGVEVMDNGVGIQEENIKHIWDRYFKTDKTSRTRMVGTGLGLAIVKSILEAHNALYGVESKENTGTKFWFKLKK